LTELKRYSKIPWKTETQRIIKPKLQSPRREGSSGIIGVVSNRGDSERRGQAGKCDDVCIPRCRRRGQRRLACCSGRERGPTTCCVPGRKGGDSKIIVWLSERWYHVEGNPSHAEERSNGRMASKAACHITAKGMRFEAVPQPRPLHLTSQLGN